MDLISPTLTLIILQALTILYIYLCMYILCVCTCARWALEQWAFWKIGKNLMNIELTGLKFGCDLALVMWLWSSHHYIYIYIYILKYMLCSISWKSTEWEQWNTSFIQSETHIPIAKMKAVKSVIHFQEMIACHTVCSYLCHFLKMLFQQHQQFLMKCPKASNIFRCELTFLMFPIIIINIM